MSYCLNEWAILGKVYPEAKDRLVWKKEETFRLLEETQDPRLFHDYLALCGYAGLKKEPIESFLLLNEFTPKLAKECVRYIWDELVEAKLWTVCNSYLNDPEKNLEDAFQKFDVSMEISEDPMCGGDEFKQLIKEWFITDLSHILLALKNSNREKEFEHIRESGFNGIQHRGYPELLKKIKKKISQ